MNKSILTTLLILLFVVQLSIPAKMIYDQEDTIMTGTAYKFKTQPIDPTDPFRGKYIVLNYEMDSFETDEASWSHHKGNVFVYLKTNSDGFAEVKTVSKTKLDISDDYVIAESRYNYGNKVNFDLHFDRFYMNEKKAYDAEISVRKAQVDTTTICYGLVMVKNGSAVLENVFIDETPIKEFVEAYQKESNKVNLE